MSAPFGDYLHGSPDKLNTILDQYPADEQELRAALQNVLGLVAVLQAKVEILEKKAFPGME